MDLKSFIKSLLAINVSDDAVVVAVMPTVKVALKKSMITEDNKIKFLNYMKSIPNIYKGQSYLEMANKAGIEPQLAKICLGVGKVFGLWSLTPMDMDESMHKGFLEQDEGIGMLPMHSGLHPRGV